MGTSWSARIAAPAAGLPDGVEAGILSVLASVIAQMSNWEPDSGISRFNRSAPGEWQPLPPDFLTVLHAGLHVAERSGGAFDPAIGDAVEAWGFGPGASRSPSPLPAQSWRAIEIDGGRARRLAPVALDFSGIAKGFAVDAVAGCLSDMGLRNFLVEIGGELRGSSVKPDGQPWWVDLEAPPGMTLPVTHVALCGLSVATSGDYRRYFEEGGKRYAHSIDPRTAAPIDNGVASVSVFHESAMIADAWATALTVLGVERGLALAADEGLAALMITRKEDGAAKEWMTPAFAAMLG
ncbi:FAD:protein FMN transferase [Sphingobium phenoxybenzoativorans]|uniref:FAD:protein FMN transferase n=1 Tax=Sphingobium phenoxybenzoativorans TaxID=1592790 RepID=A0A975KD14_9SPHN|nr:FAD:protein FMN transferase [Sphingobium phenoxybenzoativorans]QUT08062.1 FAD:protein FMN transferase [Sphingobium phenoxybenzoativorans]